MTIQDTAVEIVLLERLTLRTKQIVQLSQENQQLKDELNKLKLQAAKNEGEENG